MLWPIHPHPLPDELLSSWMIRLARGNGYKVHSFTATFFGSHRQVWNRDIDHHAPPWLLNELADRSGTPHARIVETTLRAYEGLAFEYLNPMGVTKWILPLGIYHRTRRAYGQQFCPLCLAEDAEPYLRRRWRLALLAICTRHGVLLQDRCGSCGHPVAPHRLDILERHGFPAKTNMLRCYKCRMHLTGAVTVASVDDVHMQHQIESILRSGLATIEPRTLIYSHLYFDGLRLIMRIAPRSQPTRQRIGFEFEEHLQRLELLRNSVQLLVDWPQRFLNWCSTLPHAYTTITRGAADPPYWLHSVLRQHLFSGVAPLSKAEALAIVAATQRIDPTAGVVSSSRKLSGRDIGHFLPISSVSDDTASLLIASIDQEISIADGVRKNYLLRDKVMLIAARSLHLKITQLLKITTDDVGAYESAVFSMADSPENVWAMLQWYGAHVRPNGYPETRALFITNDGRRLGANACGVRLQRAVRVAGLRQIIPTWAHWVRQRGVDP